MICGEVKMEQSEIAKIKAHQMLANLAGETPQTYRNSPLADWEKAISKGIESGVNVQPFIEDARKIRGLEKGNVSGKIMQGANNVLAALAGASDAFMFDLYPDSWYVNANNVNAVNAGKSAEAGAELAFGLPALAKLGGKLSSKALSKAMPKISGWIADDVVKTPRQVSKMLKQFNKTANADDLAKGFKQFQDAQALASKSKGVPVKAPTIDDFIKTKLSEHSNLIKEAETLNKRASSYANKMEQVSEMLNLERNNYNLFSEALNNAMPKYQQALTKGYSPSSKSISNYTKLRDGAKKSADLINEYKKKISGYEDIISKLKESEAGFTVQADDLLKNVINPLEEAKKLQEASALAKKTITPKEAIRGAHSLVKAGQLANYMNNLNNPDSDRGVNNPFNPRNIREYQQNVISNSFMPMGMPMNQ